MNKDKVSGLSEDPQDLISTFWNNLPNPSMLTTHLDDTECFPDKVLS